ncbi:hypothetical protein I7I48_10778 [Histoplasma ohiense]|nr:hypothetical protein I7I48_10778 [Histoplasma ohiense (nom. inval.)]
MRSVRWATTANYPMCSVVNGVWAGRYFENIMDGDRPRLTDSPCWQYVIDATNITNLPACARHIPSPSF